LIFPYVTVPVRIVPLPLILKQWSTSIVNFLSTPYLLGIYNSFNNVIFKSLQYFSIFYLAEYGIIVTFYPNFVLLKTFFKACIFGAIDFYYKQSTLFNTIINFLMNISATIMH